MIVVITGATGFIGSGLCTSLISKGHSVRALTRNPAKAMSKLGSEISILPWNADSDELLSSSLKDADAVVNLVGENISSNRWTKKEMDLILDSRVRVGKAVSRAIRISKHIPALLSFIQASAVGFYGSRGDELLDEQSSSGEGFLPQVACQWEESTREIETLGIRRVVVRSGVVLSNRGGALPRILLPFRFHLGGTIGSGKQWIPWIHYDDEIASIVFLLENKNLSGTFNLTAPEPATYEQLCSLIARFMRRKSWLPVPPFALRVALGKMADELLLTSQRVVPKRLQESGFQFKFPSLTDALRDILNAS